MANRGKESELAPDAITRAIRRAEEDRTRSAYELQPDSESEADDWSGARSTRNDFGLAVPPWYPQKLGTTPINLGSY